MPRKAVTSNVNNETILQDNSCVRVNKWDSYIRNRKPKSSVSATYIPANIKTQFFKDERFIYLLYLRYFGRYSNAFKCFGARTIKLIGCHDRWTLHTG